MLQTSIQTGTVPNLQIIGLHPSLVRNGRQPNSPHFTLNSRCSLTWAVAKINFGVTRLHGYKLVYSWPMAHVSKPIVGNAADQQGGAC